VTTDIPTRNSKSNFGRGRVAFFLYVYISPPHLPKNCPFPWSGSIWILDPWYLGPTRPSSHHPKKKVDRLSRSFKIHGRYQRTDRQTDRTITETGLYQQPLLYARATRPIQGKFTCIHDVCSPFVPMLYSLDVRGKIRAGAWNFCLGGPKQTT